MPAKITQEIAPQSYELARDKIVQILQVEMQGQYALNNSNPNIQQVWCERFVSFDETEFPAINVNIARGEYSNANQRKADGWYTINIDVYTTAQTTDDARADKAAMLLMHKIVGMCRAILSSPVYNILDLPVGIVGRTAVDKFFVGAKSQDSVPDALSSVVGRLQFNVLAIENVQLAESAALELATTVVRLNASPYGYYYGVDIPPTRFFTTEVPARYFIMER